MEQVVQRSCGISIVGKTENPTDNGPGQPSVLDPASERRLD